MSTGQETQISGRNRQSISDNLFQRLEYTRCRLAKSYTVLPCLSQRQGSQPTNAPCWPSVPVPETGLATGNGAQLTPCRVDILPAGHRCLPLPRAPETRLASAWPIQRRRACPRDPLIPVHVGFNQLTIVPRDRELVRDYTSIAIFSRDRVPSRVRPARQPAACSRDRAQLLDVWPGKLDVEHGGSRDPAARLVMHGYLLQRQGSAPGCMARKT